MTVDCEWTSFYLRTTVENHVSQLKFLFIVRCRLIVASVSHSAPGGWSINFHLGRRRRGEEEERRGEERLEQGEQHVDRNSRCPRN